ncbi:MAG: hypothetical protein KDD39_08785 [Bdellovibrionales bacterium]|nr:hypothetical protein [Bdellovibrionales bacterium]
MTEENEFDKNEPKGPIAGIVRELALTGLATFFMTEDSVRKYLKELKLPKELAGFLLDSASKKKDDFYGMLAKEIGRVVSKVDIEKAVGKFLEGHEVKVNASFSFTPKKKG